MRLTHPFQPIYDAEARVLILGSFPSRGSVEAGGYYGHSSNQFWRILGEVLNKVELGWITPPPDIVRTTPIWDLRYGTLKWYKIALWDVVLSCERSGPHADIDIQKPEPNDIPLLIYHSAPRIHTVLCNGVMPFRYFLRSFPQYGDPNTPIKHLVEHYPGGETFSTWRMPSTSAANRMPYEKKLKAWRDALHYEQVV